MTFRLTAGAEVAETVRLAPGLEVPATELMWRFSTAGGPGGQHVNTSNTRVEVRWDVAASASLSPAVRDRLLARLGPVVRAAASDRRSQIQNRRLAEERLAAMVRAALVERTPRRPTRPTAASQRRRLEAKRRQGQVKRQRQGRWDET